MSTRANGERKARQHATLTILAAAAMLGGGNAAADATLAATIGWGCSQEDAAALLIELPPDMTIEIAGAGDAPFELVLSPLRRDPKTLTTPFARAQLRQPPAMPLWLSGTLRIERLVIGRSAAGAYDFLAPGDRRLRGRFDAIWKAGNPGCG